MITLTDPITLTPAAPARPRMLRLLRSERLKMTSTKAWWLYGIAILGGTGLVLLFSILSLADDLQHGVGAQLDNNPPQTVATIAARHAPEIFTSGQYLGGLFVMLLSILLITNEYHHQTVTSTFLATPRRTPVIAAKFITAMLAAALVWVIVTAIDVITGVTYYAAHGLDNGLGTTTVLRAIVVNLLMFVLWGIFGIGIGALLRSQIGATVTSAVAYTAGIYGAFAVIALIHGYIFKHDVVWKAVVLFPALAAQIAESADTLDLPGGVHVHWWVGVIVMLGYGGVMTLIGTLILRKRDVS